MLHYHYLLLEERGGDGVETGRLEEGRVERGEAKWDERGRGRGGVEWLDKSK